MGEVWKARDTRLGREVAIKVLPVELAADESRLRRFEKEARAASSLNHPNIVTIYEIGQSDSVSYIAMELVEGKTLREVLATGALPTRRLLAVAAQIGDGLAKAHASGIVHRDLKPENVMITKDGLVKILDFGLAKLTQPDAQAGQETQAPTITQATEAGIVMGTVAYMSPEQASGHPVDYRSDQFSFGSVLYEIATGKRPFDGKTKPEILAAIIRDEPESIAGTNAKVPPPLRWIIEQCLAKDPKDRYVSTEDLARDLATVRNHLSEVSSGAVAAAAETGALRRRLALPILGAIGGAVVLLAAGILSDRWLSSRWIRTVVPSFHRLTFRRGSVLTARFARDGRTVVYGAAWDGAPAEIFTVRTDSVESRPVGLSGADLRGVSSKGELAVLLKKTNVTMKSGSGTLARIPLEGGTPREVLADVTQADWAPNGEDLAVVVQKSSVADAQLQYPIGTLLHEGLFKLIRVSPKGDLVAYSSWEEDKAGTINIIDRKGKHKILSKGWSDITGLAWSPGGEIVFVSAGEREGTRAGDSRGVAFGARTRPAFQCRRSASPRRGLRRPSPRRTSCSPRWHRLQASGREPRTGARTAGLVGCAGHFPGWQAHPLRRGRRRRGQRDLPSQNQRHARCPPRRRFLGLGHFVRRALGLLYRERTSTRSAPDTHRARDDEENSVRRDSHRRRTSSERKGIRCQLQGQGWKIY